MKNVLFVATLVLAVSFAHAEDKKQTPQQALMGT